jgi:hypothetical protein
MPINHVKNVTVPDSTNTDIVRPSDWNSVHAYTLQDAVSLTGNTAGVLANISSGTFYLAGGNNITLSQNANSVTISQANPFISSYENLQWGSTQTQTLGGTSVSAAVAFQLPQPLSASFLRMPVQMTTNSTTLATTAATMNASVQFLSTWNAVIYSLGTGASSQSLISVASGSAGFTFMNSISVDPTGTQYSVTQGFSAQAQGGGTTRTTQYSISNTNYSFTTNQIATEWSGGRFLDIPLANTFSAGPYWLVFGYSSSTNTNSTGVSAASNCNVRYSNHWGAIQPNVAFGVMGSTNITSGNMGAGSFSTAAGGGTTSAFPYSAISSSASYLRPYFQLLRSA